MFLSVPIKKAALITLSLLFFIESHAVSKLNATSILKTPFLIDSKTVVEENNETHADLKLIEKLFPTENFKVEIDFRIKKQYRKLANPWESFWLFWSYNLDGDSKKFTNYIIFKSNEIELGKAFDEIGQEFIFTKKINAINLSKWQKIKILKTKHLLTIIWNEQQIEIAENIFNQLYPYPGKIGLYTEDAQVEIRNFKILF